MPIFNVQILSMVNMQFKEKKNNKKIIINSPSEVILFISFQKTQLSEVRLITSKSP